MMSLNSLSPDIKAGQWTHIKQGLLYWQNDFLPHIEADELLQRLISHVPWRQESIYLFGKWIPQPRLQAWYGDMDYTYSGLHQSARPLLPELAVLRERCAQIAEQSFNSVLLNYYRHGQDSMGWHQDNEPELGTNPVIASVSLGESRRFVLKNLHCKSKIEFNLTHGSILIMAGDLQHHWQHCVPKTRTTKEARLNLTFRLIK